MEQLLQRDLGSSLLSISVLLGWLGISFVFLRISAILIKKLLEAVFKDSKWSFEDKIKSYSPIQKWN